MAGEKNFFVSLFDVSFKEFVTPRMISFIYILIMVVLGLVSLVWLVMSLAAGQWWTIILAPVGFFIYLILVRMWLEMFMVFFRIMRRWTPWPRPRAWPGRPPGADSARAARPHYLMRPFRGRI